MYTNLFIKWPIIFLSFLKGTLSSIGDSSPFYGFCVKNCKAKICDAGKQFNYNFFGFGFSVWSCLENCEYDCQWKTVAAFQRQDWPVPQFKGKWPFIRLFGIQEPASVFFSLLNFIVILKLLILFRKSVPKSSPFYFLWTTYAIVQLNSWIWSCVYHTRDTYFTEKMDYMSAFFVILFSFYGAGMRYINTSFNLKTLFWSVFCALIGVNHTAYLWMYNFDYGYNMKLNCILGGVGVFLWFFWSYLHLNSQPFVWKIFLFAVLVTLSTLLELLDFPPIFWLFDAHALWHCSTLVVNYMFFQFVIDDCNYLCNISESSFHKIKKKNKM